MAFETLTDEELKQISDLSSESFDTACKLVARIATSRNEEYQPKALMEALAFTARCSTTQAVNLIYRAYAEDYPSDEVLEITTSILNKINASVRNYRDPAMRN